MSASLRRRISISELEEWIDAVELAQTDDCREIVGLAGFDPAKDLRFGDFTDCDFDGQDLGGFDFTGCDLRRSTFDGARIRAANLDCAMFDLRALQKAADYEAFLKRDLGRGPATRYRVNGSRLRDLAVFREAPFAPEMVIIPAGQFMMGSDLGEAKLAGDDEAYDDEIVPRQGKRLISIPRRFAIGRYPVTFEEYDLFCGVVGYPKPGHRKWGRGRRPVISVSWDDAQDYTAWLNRKLGGAAYRLPSEAEWEYSCRAGTITRRWWGDAWDPKRANGARSFRGGRTSPVAHFPPNPWGLHDMIGNVDEWCADEWVDNISSLPEDGITYGFQNKQIQTKGGHTKKSKKNPLRALRGGSWSGDPRTLRSAVRDWLVPDDRGVNLGFRLSRTL
jgi:formylglycine-generating enzyme required for sulfatase activity